MSKWSEAVNKKLVHYLESGLTYREIALLLTQEFGFDYSKDSVRSRVRNNYIPDFDKEKRKDKFEVNVSDRSIQKLSTEDVESVLISKFAEVKKSQPQLTSKLFPDDVYEINEEVSFTPEKKRILNKLYDKYNDGKPKKILSLSDLHAPFINFNSVEKAILANLDADIVMLNGDVFDGHAMSDFDKLNDFDIEIEFKQVFTLLDVLTKQFKEIIWVTKLLR